MHQLNITTKVTGTSQMSFILRPVHITPHDTLFQKLTLISLIYHFTNTLRRVITGESAWCLSERATRNECDALNLLAYIYVDLVTGWLTVLVVRPPCTSRCPPATLKDISVDKQNGFDVPVASVFTDVIQGIV